MGIGGKGRKFVLEIIFRKKKKCFHPVSPLPGGFKTGAAYGQNLTQISEGENQGDVLE